MSSLELLEDACARIPHTTRKMFGGHGLFAPNGGMFAGIVDDDRIILKLADEAARKELCDLGTGPWVYGGTQGSMTMREWILAPDAFYDSPTELQEWAERAWKLAPAKGEKKPGGKKAAGQKSGGKKAAAKTTRRKPTPTKATKRAAKTAKKAATPKAAPKKTPTRKRVRG